MTRQHTPLSQRVASHSPGGRPQRINTVARREVPFYKSALGTKAFQARRTRRGAPSASASRFFKNLPALPSIEEEGSQDVSPWRSTKSEFHKRLDALTQETDVYEREDEDMMEWDEESTLIALLKDEDKEESEEHDLDALIDRIKAPMNAQSQELKRYVVETIFPVVQRVKEVHDTLDDTVDTEYGTGLLAFDEVCKRVEALALKTEDELRTEYMRSQSEIEDITTQIAAAYERRDKLWADLERDLGECAKRARAAIESVPEAVESTITRLEKKSKEMEKNSTSQATKHKMIKDLFGRL